MADKFEEALAKAKQLAAKYGCEAAASNSNGATKRSAEEDDDEDGTGAKRPVNDAMAAAAEAAAKINQKIGGSSSNPFSGPYNAAIKTLNYGVPDNMVGLLIGKKGEQIVRIQAETGCKVQITLESNGTAERPCTLIGTEEQIDAVKKIFDEIVGKAAITQGANNMNFAGQGQIQTIEISVPGTKAGLIIGKSGETIKGLMEQYGVKMVLVQDSNMPTHLDKPLRISGDPERVEKVKSIVIDLLNARATIGPAGIAPTVGEGSSTFAVPSDKAGLVIGRGGETIKEIMTNSGAYVAISKAPTPDPSIKIFNINGTTAQMEHATRIICEKAGLPIPSNIDTAQANTFSSGYENPYSANQAQTFGQAAQPAAMPAPTVNAQTGQLDYSAAWIQYYRSKGMHEAADKIQAQVQQQHNSRVPAVSTAANAYGYSQQNTSNQWSQPASQWSQQSQYSGWNTSRTG